MQPRPATKLLTSHRNVATATVNTQPIIVNAPTTSRPLPQRNQIHKTSHHRQQLLALSAIVSLINQDG